jgi:hypothetical protein
MGHDKNAVYCKNRMDLCRVIATCTQCTARTEWIFVGHCNLYAVVRLPSGTKSILLDHDGEIKLQQPTVRPISVGIGIGRALAPAGRSSDFDPTRAGQILLFRDESGSPVSHSRNSRPRSRICIWYLSIYKQ